MYIDKNIIRFSYDFSTVNWENNSGKCKGTIYFDVFSDSGEILDRYIEFKSIKMDIFTTSSWFDRNNSNLRYRESLFKKLWDNKIIQERRPSRRSHKIIELNNNEIELANKWFNSEYKSTLKNIIAIISGNNPTGSFTDPNAAQMYISNDNLEEKYRKNFIMFFDKIWEISIKDYDKFIKNNIDIMKISYIDFLKLKNDTLINLLDTLCEYNPKNKNCIVEIYIKNIEKNLNKLIFLRNDLRKKIEEYRRKLPNLDYFEVSSTKSQKAHIKNVSIIKNENFIKLNEVCNLHFIKHTLENDEFTKKIEEIHIFAKNEITTKDNLLKMSSHIHELFDDNYFTYSSENGNIIWNKNKLNKLTNADKEIILKEYSKINDLENRKKFLISRNMDLKNFIS